MKDHGYTDSELAAAAWRKQQQLAKSVVTNSMSKDTQRRPADELRGRRDRKSSSHYRSRSRSRSPASYRSHQDRKRDRSRSRSERKDRRIKEHRKDKHHKHHRDHRNESRHSNSDVHDNNEAEPEQDEFGRILPKGSKRRIPDTRASSRSRSRSRSRSGSRGRDKKWSHDKFHCAEYDDEDSRDR